MTRLRPHVLLGLLIAFAITTAAVARPGAELSMQSGLDSAITMVICASDGAETVTVTFDRDGPSHQPGSDHDCQTCLVCASQAEVTSNLSPNWAVPRTFSQKADTRSRSGREVGLALQEYLPRGPPKES